MKSRILTFLQGNGEKLDAQIARALKMPMSEVRQEMAQLARTHEVVCCTVTRFVEGGKIEGLSCRASCEMPAATRGRKPNGALMAPDPEQ